MNLEEKKMHIELYFILKWNAYLHIVVKIKYKNIENFGLVAKIMFTQ